MDKNDILPYFSKLIKDDPDISAAVAAIKTLLKFIEANKVETLSEMRDRLKDAINILTQTDSSVTSISSGCELFLRFITLANLQHSDFQECQKILVQRGNMFLQKVASSRQKIAKITYPFITDGASCTCGVLYLGKMKEEEKIIKSTILTHSRSRVVLQVLKDAAVARRRFKVYVTESLPDQSGHRVCEELSSLGIPTTVVLDAAVGYVMEKVDLVLVGAEGVVESGGIINKIGTYTMAISAQAMNKPVYVVAESFKFVRLYPLNQQDLPNQFKYHSTTLKSGEDLGKVHPLVDYTPPAYITLLFTDLGVLTPSAVSDELIKLYC